jgi:prepilin-type N-terminal cleavage/methylation domain-containing protein
MPAKRRRRGFTLVEMLISMALLAMIMVAACLAVQAAGAAHSYNSEKGELVARARGILDWIALDVRRSDSVTLNNDKSLTVTRTNYPDRTYAWDGAQGGHVTYSETDPDTGAPSTPVTLTGYIPPGPPVTLAGYVDEFHVEQVGTGCRVQITLDAEPPADEGKGKRQRAKCQAAITATPLKSLY